MKVRNKPNSVEYILLLLPLFVAMGSFVFDIKNPIFNFFSRSGAVMVICGVILQFINDDLHLKEIKYAIDITGIIDGIPYGSYDFSKRNYLVFIAYLYMIIGTLVWGYGDIVIKIVT